MLKGTLINPDVGFVAGKTTYIYENFVYNPYKNEFLVFGYVEDGRNIVYRSTDLVNFTKIVSNNSLSAESTLVFDETYYYTGGKESLGGSYYMRLFRSENLLNWERLNIGSGKYGSILPVGDVLIFEGELLYYTSYTEGFYISNDHGTTWSNVSGTRGLLVSGGVGKIIKINGKYIICAGTYVGSSGAIYISDDFVTFTKVYNSALQGSGVFDSFFYEEEEEYVFAQSNGLLITKDFTTFRHVPQSINSGDVRSPGTLVCLNKTYFLIHNDQYLMVTGDKLRLPTIENAFIRAY